MKRLFARPLIVIAVLLGATGCASEDPVENPTPGPLVDLVNRVATSGNDRSILAVDFAAARAALGLPADADPLSGFGGSDSQRRFLAVTATIPHLAMPQESVMHDAIDAGRISAAATNLVRGAGSLTVARTSQDFDEIADTLVGAGYQRNGDLLAYAGDQRLSSGPVYSHVAGRAGLIAMTSDTTGAQGAESVRRALGDAPPSESGKLATELPGPGLAVVRFDNGCVRAMTMVDPFDGKDSRLSLLARNETSAVTFVGDRSTTLSRSHRFGPAERTDDQLRIPFQTTRPNTNPLSLITGDIPAGDLWKCS